LVANRNVDQTPASGSPRWYSTAITDFDWCTQTKIETLLCPSSTVGTNPHVVWFRGSVWLGIWRSAPETDLNHTNYLHCSGRRGDNATISDGSWRGMLTNRSRTNFGGCPDGSSNTFLAGEASFCEDPWGGQDAQGNFFKADHSWMVGSLMTGFGHTIHRVDAGTAFAPYTIGFNSEHAGSAINYAMTAGSVHNVNEALDFVAYISLSGKEEGRLVSVDDY
jgi:hypothetical protein